MRTYSLALAVVLLCCRFGFAGGKIQYVVADTHPTGGKGATLKQITFFQGDPRFQVEGPGKCGDLFLGGFAFGHPDPRLKNPKAVCGHGFVLRLHDQVITGPSPLSILPIEAPMPVEANGAAAVDAAKVIRELLPRLDKSDGDKLPAVVQLRESIRTVDVLNGTKALPKRQPRN